MFESAGEKRGCIASRERLNDSGSDDSILAQHGDRCLVWESGCKYSVQPPAFRISHEPQHAVIWPIDLQS